MTILLAVLASGFIGVSDFVGGMASRNDSALQVTAVLHVAALVTLIPLALVLGASHLTLHDGALGAISGLATGLAYVGFFAAIGHGRLSIVVPVSAATTALVPATVGIAQGNVLSSLAMAGILCALVSIPLVAYEPDHDNQDTKLWSAARQLAMSVLCGAGFGIFFVCIGHTSRGSGLWPTVGNLTVGAAVTCAIALARGLTLRPSSVPRLAMLGGLMLGVADSMLTTALQRGPLTVASVLGNLYPIVTIALGVLVLGERVRLWQAAGIALAVGGVAMIAAG